MKRLEVGTLVRVIHPSSKQYGNEGVIWRIDILPAWNPRSAHHVPKWKFWRKPPVAFLLDLKGVGKLYRMADGEMVFYGYAADEIEPVVPGTQEKATWSSLKRLLGFDPRQPVKPKEPEKEPA